MGCTDFGDNRMKIESLNFRAEGYVDCKSGFYTAQDNLSFDVEYTFKTGINKLIGEIDSNVWATSYYLSMYKFRKKDFIIFENDGIIVNDSKLSLDELSEYTCYMDEGFYPLFSTGKSVRKLIMHGIKKNKLDCAPDDIKSIFELDDQRFERPVKCVGNERFRAMAAIGYAHGKQVYCFPWLSKKRFDYYHGNITYLLDMLEELGMIAIVPIGE